jgi:predicted metal-dependent hydrolase
MTSAPKNASQLELFAQDFFAALEPAPRPLPHQPLFKAPPQVEPIPLLPLQPLQPLSSPKRQIQLGSHTVEYELKRSARRTIGFMIDDAGLHVTAPKRLTLSEIDNAIRAKQRWIVTKLLERGERRAIREEKPVAWVDGARLPYMGGEITLRLEPAARSHCYFDAVLQELNVGVVPGLQEWQLQERVRLWFESQARKVFRERLDHYAQKMGVSYNAFALTSAGTRWGSCTVEGNIRLNWRLMHYPLPLIDYVVAHELAHLREMNHSPRFWATVGTVYPDYEGAKAALKKRSAELPIVFA